MTRPAHPDAETVAAPLTRANATVGTLEYMSPEQARGRQLDARTDLFSLGGVLYEMITCRRAFFGSTPASALRCDSEHRSHSSADDQSRDSGQAGRDHPGDAGEGSGPAPAERGCGPHGIPATAARHGAGAGRDIAPAADSGSSVTQVGTPSPRSASRQHQPRVRVRAEGPSRCCRLRMTAATRNSTT